MKIIISSDEVKEAICDYIENVHKFSVSPVDLEPIYEVHGEYEDTIKTQVGFQFDASQATRS